MSQKKIIFLIIMGVILISLIIAVAYISNKTKTVATTPSNIKIWITEGTSDSYTDLIEGFKAYAPEYNKSTITIEKQTSDPERYRTLVLNTLTEGNGPDIFMLHSGEDAILESKVDPIPSSVINFSDFQKRYDDIFLGLITSTGSGNDKAEYLLGVPIGYETLGVFYNKALLREVPKTWNDIEGLYSNFAREKYPTNLGMGPAYMPNMVDILPIWLRQSGSESYEDVGSANTGIRDYLAYGNIGVSEQVSDTETTDEALYSSKATLSAQRGSMLESKMTTLDLFMQGDIGMILGYPSLVLELEKSAKKVGITNVSNLILTDRLPQFSGQRTENIGRYTYFGISKLSENSMASAKFLEYLMTPDAQRLIMRAYPYLIPAQSEFYTTASSLSLSDTLARTRLESFIPAIGDNLSLYHYGLKSRFERYLKEGIDTIDTPDIESMTSKIKQDISCEINTALGGNSEDGACQNQ